MAKTKILKPRPKSRQSQIIEAVFKERFLPGAASFEFSREDLFDVCRRHGIDPLANMGDGAVYSYRYRAKLPDPILATQPPGKEWVILGKGISKYEFRLVSQSNIVPNQNLLSVKIPDSTPEIIKRYALSDEQALLARIRYNRLVDIFFGLATYSLQNHLRTSVEEIGQIEIDEIYVGLDRKGRHFILPAQAKVGKDKIGYAQLYQDISYCQAKYPGLICRPIAAKFMSDGSANGVIAMFELVIDGDQVRVVQEQHYRLVPTEQISDKDLELYGRAT